jgi:hypothetical protein
MKPWYQSKTLWLNLIAVVVGVAPIIAANAKVIAPEQAAAIDSIVGTLVGVGNVVLRVWFTDTPIATPKAEAKLAARLEDERMDSLQ